ncbi:Uu.00g143810.m01.CDS01 [Anthostomella pinea]|uniref:Uu.00g143810.m01.CDS01 n=1 Tax=Anthostomella pinea TaxID=933095 RepID=A0AAI8VK83_9PEZI|nr:Uu.00g143810.m01.CDS01 [Anthostomella pinea]
MPVVIGTVTLVIPVSTLFVSARAFARTYFHPKHHAEDWLSYLAWVGLVAYTGILIPASREGLSQHQRDVTVAQFVNITYYINILSCIYAPTTLAAKLSVLLQIKRIFTTGARDRVYWAIVVSIAANSLFYTAECSIHVFSCWPRERILDPRVPGHCLYNVEDGVIERVFLANVGPGTANFFSDVFALALPAWAIWKLQMPVRRKLEEAYAVFGVGALACVVGAAGLYLRIRSALDEDFAWLATQSQLLM